MTERPENPGGLRKMKNLEKPQIANNREYLDMDTDEEEFGRQETPEPEEELEIEPEKPVFTEEELKTLVRYVKDFTTLSNLEESNWSTEIILMVEEYFCNPANTVLTIFHESGRLRCSLNFPDRTDRGLTYFLRTPWQIYTPENFLSSVIFGSVNDAVENSTLKFVDNMYAPVAFRSEEWPAVMRNEIFSNLHEFLMRLTDATYDPMGLTILYIPREGLEDKRTFSQTIIEKSRDNIEEIICETGDDEAEGLVERLERVARYWIRQIREALSGTCSFVKSSPCKTIVDEILYWHYRHDNLSCVYHQLTNKSVVEIVEKLERERSASVKRYNPLLTQLRDMLDEATSNITYLNLLEGFDRGFDIPDGLEEYATRVFLLIRFIGTESSFYRGKERVEKLSRAFCTQAVEHLRQNVNLDIIFDGDPNEARRTIVECIDCCKIIENIYDRVVRMDESSDSPVVSLACKSKVFNYVDSFVQRCNDLIFIADSRMAFDKWECINNSSIFVIRDTGTSRSDESITIYGPRGTELEKNYRKIEKRFHATLCEIENARDDILDIVSANWLDRMVHFREGIKNIENMVKNWISDVFESILNVEEGIEALHGIKSFSRRSNLREALNDKWTQIWKMFGRELESCSILTNKDSVLLHHPSLPPYSGNASIIRNNIIYLARQYKMLTDASDWFDDCDAQNAITKKYKRVLSAMTEKEEALFRDWQKYLEDKQINPESLSKKSILKYHDTKFPTTQVNLEIHCFNNIREITEWTYLNYETKNIFTKNNPKWRALKSRYNKVESVCKLYNNILENLSKSERLFFSTLLDDLEDTVSSGFKKITWTSESFERFFTDCMEALIKVQESFEIYRSVDWKIDRTMKQIATTSLVNCDKSLVETLEDSKNRLEQDRLDGAAKVGNKCKTILKLLLELKTRINIDEPQTADHWNCYKADMYEKLKDNFTKCMRLSVLSGLEFIRGDYLYEPTRLVEICVDRELIREIEGKIARVNASAFEATFPVDEFAELFGTSNGSQVFVDKIDRDPEIMNLRAQIDQFFSPIYAK